LYTLQEVKTAYYTNSLILTNQLMKNNKTNTQVDQYISEFDPVIQKRLRKLQNLFFEVLPNTKESIRYKIPAYEVGNHYLYFAGYKNHIVFILCMV
jgi:hypothetical protein